jgi:hypothetical protein
VAQAAELAAALREGGASDVTAVRFPSTNHLLLEDADGDPRGYARLTTRALRADVVRVVGDWIRAH